MKVKAIKLQDYYKNTDCMYTNIIIAAKRARQIIDSRYEKIMLEKNIEDTDQLEALVAEEDFDLDKPISQAMQEFLNRELDWRETESLDTDE